MDTPIRLVAIDIDGTLLDSRRRLLPETEQAVEQVQQRGVLVTLATGRTWSSALPFAKRLKIKIPIVSHNGACIRSADSEAAILRKPMDMQLARDMVRNLEIAGCYVKVYVDDHLYVQEDTPETIAFSRDFGVAYTAVGQGRLADLAHDPLKISVVERSARIQTAWRILADWTDMFSIHRDGEYGIEITEKTADKATGIARICADYGVSWPNVLAIGNEGNDRLLLQQAGIGVAMGNAYEGLKQVADLVARTNDEQGVACILNKLILQDKTFC